MPLQPMSPNIQERESPSRKRCLEDFFEHHHGDSLCFPSLDDSKAPLSGIENFSSEPAISLLPANLATQSPPAQSSPASLTDAGSSTPTRQSPSPNRTPTRTPPLPSVSTQPSAVPDPVLSQAAMSSASASGQGSGQPPAKRKKLTPAEKEEKARAEALRKQQREEKARAEAVRKQQREEQKAAREAAKSKAEAERQAKRDEKETKERQAQEAKEKKERGQMRLNKFFTAGPSTPKKAALGASGRTSAAASPAKTPNAAPVDGTSAYEKMFRPFFVKENVTLATNVSGMDCEVKAAKSRILDEHIRGERGPISSPKLGPTTSANYFQPQSPPRPRGRRRPAVRALLSAMSDASTYINLTSDPESAKTKTAHDLLREVPMKLFSFREDVRPAYYGTITSLPSSGNLAKLARKPTAKTVLALNYDYDSEAEWVDDDGEDVDDPDEEEEDVDDDEEMGDFLDDEEDGGVPRAAFATGMEPESTGLCWEDRKRLGPLARMYKFRMEFILESLPRHHSIDPFSTTYWEPEVPKTKAAGAEQTTSAPAASAAAPSASAPAVMPPPPVPALGIFGVAAPAAGRTDAKKATIPPHLIDAFRHAVQKYEKLTKLGLIEMLGTEFGKKCTKGQIRNTIETMAERTGTGSDKTWKWKGDSLSVT